MYWNQNSSLVTPTPAAVAASIAMTTFSIVMRRSSNRICQGLSRLHLAGSQSALVREPNKGDACEEALHRCHDRGFQCGWSCTLCHCCRPEQCVCSANDWEDQEEARVCSAN